MLNFTRPWATPMLPTLALLVAGGPCIASAQGDPATTITPATPSTTQPVAASASAAASGDSGAPAAPASGSAEATPRIEATKLPRKFGTIGDTRINFLLGVASDFDGTEVAQGGVGVSWFVVDSLSIDLELLGVGVFQEEDDAGGASANLLFRWHFWHNEARTISIYGDVGVGFAGLSEDVPPDGSNYNFTPQIGFGASFEIGANTRLMTGVRWLHFSNAQLSSDNPGLDTALLYAGVSIGF